MSVPSDSIDRLIESRIQQTLEVLTRDDCRIENPSFSVGHKVFRLTDNFNIDEMLSVADALMYENKQKSKKQ